MIGLRVRSRPRAEVEHVCIERPSGAAGVAPPGEVNLVPGGVIGRTGCGRGRLPDSARPRGRQRSGGALLQRNQPKRRPLARPTEPEVSIAAQRRRRCGQRALLESGSSSMPLVLPIMLLRLLVLLPPVVVLVILFMLAVVGQRLGSRASCKRCPRDWRREWRDQ